MTSIISVGTRGSRLALAQTRLVIGLLKEKERGLRFEVKPIKTQGDETHRKQLPDLTGKEAFTGTIDRALEEGEIDFAVHSLKDVPLKSSRKTVLSALPKRGAFRDVLITRQRGMRLETLPPGSCIGTSSLRRAVQLKSYRPDLKIVETHGNVSTRIEKLRRGLDAIVVARAGLDRLGIRRIIEELSTDIMLPAAGQGCLAVSTRSDDSGMKSLVSKIDHKETRISVTAERAFSAEFGGGCNLPVGALAQCKAGVLTLEGLVADGEIVIRDSIKGSPAEADSLGRRLARKLAAM